MTGEAVSDSDLSARETVSEAARQLTEQAFVFDALALPYVLDEPYTQQCLAAGINAANVTLTGEDGWDETQRRLESMLSRIAQRSDLCLATTSEDLEQSKDDQRLSVVLGTQGAAFVEDQLWRIDSVWRLGLRFIGLAYTPANLFADGCGELRDAGLTLLGREFVQAVNERPMALDLSHSGHASQAEAALLARAPCCTHSNAFSVNPNDRNTQDDVVATTAEKGGVMGICCLPRTVAPGLPSLTNLVDHYEHLAKLAGRNSIGLGLDFQQGDQERGEQMPVSKRWRTLRPDIFGTVDDYYRQSYPEGIETVDKLSNITQELLSRGHDREAVVGVLGSNWRRFFGQALG